MKSLLALILGAFGLVVISKRAEAEPPTAPAPGTNGGGGGGPSPYAGASNIPAYAQPYIAIIQSELQRQGAPFQLAEILAIIEIESAFKPAAYRDEPQISDASRGLMQILLSSARDRGFSGAADDLFDPATNIRFGIAQLKWTNDYLQTRRGGVTREVVIGAYNAGVGNALNGYTPVVYVSKWQAALNRWRQILGR